MLQLMSRQFMSAVTALQYFDPFSEAEVKRLSNVAGHECVNVLVNNI